MKYVKTFENFNYEPTNEGLMMDWLKGIRAKWNNWKNKAVKDFADKVTKAMENASGKLKEAIDKAMVVYNKLKPELKTKLKEFLSKWTPDNKTEDAAVAAEVNKLVEVGEAIRNTKYGTALYESYEMKINESTESLAKKVLNWLGLNAEYLILMTVVVAVLAVIVASAATVIVGAMVFVGGIMACISYLVSRGTESTEEQ